MKRLSLIIQTRGILGFKPSDQEGADRLQNPNMPQTGVDAGAIDPMDLLDDTDEYSDTEELPEGEEYPAEEELPLEEDENA